MTDAPSVHSVDPSVSQSRLEAPSSRLVSRTSSFDEGARTVVPSRAPTVMGTETGSQTPPPALPQASVTFLLAPSGRRRTMSFEADTTVGRMKELVWNSWPSDWQDERPPMPAYLRVLYLGRMLMDEETLATLNVHATHPSIEAPPAPTIMHLSVRPTAAGPIVDKGRKLGRRGTDLSSDGEAGAESTGGCCGCVIC
ncbi:hypothetical protein BKA62DRAFT_713824 [Auriculariales sp. MPI-PUGE-AT-0066]|nr:hypothetical protein BKA62DRAFT_713824 [Auriculariales sp. MPI-PUGE-AT-0066]